MEELDIYHVLIHQRLDFEHRLGTDSYDSNQIVQFRSQCKNVKLRHIYYRLVSRDFYTKERMFRFGMSRDNECMRCGNIETFRHLMYECKPQTYTARTVKAILSCIQSDALTYSILGKH